MCLLFQCPFSNITQFRNAYITLEFRALDTSLDTYYSRHSLLIATLMLCPLKHPAHYQWQAIVIMPSQRINSDSRVLPVTVVNFESKNCNFCTYELEHYAFWNAKKKWMSHPSQGPRQPFLEAETSFLPLHIQNCIDII